MKTSPVFLWLIPQPKKFWRKKSAVFYFSFPETISEMILLNLRLDVQVRDMKSLFLPAHALSHQVLVELKGGNTAAAWDRFERICYGQETLHFKLSSYFPAAFDVHWTRNFQLLLCWQWSPLVRVRKQTAYGFHMLTDFVSSHFSLVIPHTNTLDWWVCW